ncbi:MAG: nucleotidyltransferase family protein [Bacillota bacterium]
MECPELLNEVTVLPDELIVRALEKMDRAARQILLVTDDEGVLLGTVTDGDVRRALLEGVNLREPVDRIMNRRPKILPIGTPLEAVRKMMVEHGIRHIPLTDDQGRLVNLIMWQDLFLSKVEARPENVVIMAGGKGTRLDPFTKILPKPMIPLRDKPIIEVIMERFNRQGFGEFVLCLGYKAEIIRLYFNGNGRSYNVSFVQEEEPLGTAGALSLLTERFKDTFLLTNCDIIVEMNYNQLLEYHREGRYALTIVGALKEFVVPYGVMHTEESRFWIEEKPNFHFLVNTGLYVLEPSVLQLIEKGKPVDMPDMIAAAQAGGFRVGIYPHHGKWFDVGQWEEYQQTLKLFESMELTG